MASCECFNCSESFANIQLYRCKTCLDKEQDLAEAVEFLCESCVSVLHLKKGHIIIDFKDHEPVLCSDHKNICTDYCKTCEILLCTKCLRNHTSHELVTIDEKASEVKSEIFTLLTDLELEEKPLRAKKETDEIVINADKQAALNLCSFIEKEMDQMKNVFLQTVKETVKMENLSEIDSAISDLVELQQKCRDQLRLSSDSLIATTSKVLDEIQQTKKVYEELFSKVIEAKYYDFDRLRHEFGKFQEIVSEIVLMTSREDSSQIYHICFNDLDYLYQMIISAVEETISLSWLHTFGSQHKIHSTYTRNFTSLNSPVKNVFPVFFQPAIWKFILIFFENKTALKYDVHTGNLTSYSYPKMTHFLWPYVMSETDKDIIFWSYWSAQTRKLKFSHDENMSVKMPDCPEVKMTSYSSSELYFITSNLSIVVADIDSKFFDNVSASVHNLDSIDSVSGFKNKLFIWSAINKTVSILAKKQNYWIKERDVSWLDKCEIFKVTLDNESCRLMPVLKIGNDISSEKSPIFAFKLGK